MQCLPATLWNRLLPSCALLLASCAANGAAPNPVLGHDARPDLVHAVAFWWSADAPPDLSERMVTLYRERVASEVPGVVEVWIGPPDPSERSVVDSSFDLMSAVRFESPEAEDGWQVHPVHDALKAEFGPYIERVQINDFTLR